MLTSRPRCGILPPVFWYPMLMRLSPLHLCFGLVSSGEQARLVLAHHHQVLALQRQLGKRSSLVPGEQLALLCRLLCRGTAPAFL